MEFPPRRPALRGLFSAALPLLSSEEEEVLLLPKAAVAFAPAPPAPRRLPFLLLVVALFSSAAAASSAPPSSVTLLLPPGQLERGEAALPCSDPSVVVAEGASGHSAAASAAAFLRLRT